MQTYIVREKERREDRKKKRNGPVSLSGFLGNQDIGMCIYLSYTYIHANMNCTIIHVTFCIFEHANSNTPPQKLH